MCDEPSSARPLRGGRGRAWEAGDKPSVPVCALGHLPLHGGGESDPPVSCLAGDRQLTAPFRQGGQTGMLGGRFFDSAALREAMTEPGGFMRICRGPPTDSRLAGDRRLPPPPLGGGKGGVRICPRWCRTELLPHLSAALTAELGTSHASRVSGSSPAGGGTGRAAEDVGPYDVGRGGGLLVAAPTA